LNDDFSGINIGPEQSSTPKPGGRNSFGLVAGVVLFAFLASGIAYLWLNYGSQVRAAVLSTSSEETPVVAQGEGALARSDFEAYRQQSIEMLRSTIAGLDAQKEKFKQISDRLSALESKVDTMQPAPQTTAAAPISQPAQTAAVVPSSVLTPRALAPKQPRRPVAPKPPGRVSVGGAPLPAQAN
jgi:hypothetical protein